MKNQLSKHFYILFLFCLLLITGCNALIFKPPLQTTYYSLERDQSKFPKEFTPNGNLNLPTLIVNMPKANAGFDTRHMMYSRVPHQLEYFAKNEWIDSPAHMLQPLLVSAIEKTGGFKAVLPKYSAVKSDIRLESEIVQLIQLFNNKPSQVQFTLRVTLIDNITNKVIAHREFDALTNATSDDPSGGVLAANQVVTTALVKLSLFCQEAVIAWQALSK